MHLGRLNCVVLLACALLMLPGCERDPLDAPCATGLVVTEISGDRDDVWVEVFVASGTAEPMDGLAIRVMALDGGSRQEFRIREAGAVAAPGTYRVLALTEPDGREGDLPDGGVMDLVSCGDVLDRVVWRKTPDEGALALGGGVEPAADANDDEGAWCAVGTDTPGEENAPCP